MENTPKPEEPRKAQEPTIKDDQKEQGPQAAFLEELNQREQAVKTKERRLLARERLQEKGLPESLLSHLDYHSDEALLLGLELASLAAKTGIVAQVPRGSEAQVMMPDTYRGRAELYLCDRGQYESLMGGTSHV